MNSSTLPERGIQLFIGQLCKVQIDFKETFHSYFMFLSVEDVLRNYGSTSLSLNLSSYLTDITISITLNRTDTMNRGEETVI